MQSNRNNFDLVRLAAASQVMFGHALEFLPQGHSTLEWILSFLPGVPAFFFVSGFLISRSYENNPHLWQFARNRLLRIYPALWGSVAFSALLISILYEADLKKMLGWILLQGTILQIWNPDFLRGYGVGVVNGSLWTIPIELFFYISTPVIYWFGHKQLNVLLAFVAVVSFGLLSALAALPTGSFVQKAGLLTPFPWIGMFACGALAQRNFDCLRPYIQDKFILWIFVFLAVVVAGRFLNAPILFRTGQNQIGLVHFLALAGLILSAAYTKPDFADRLLKRNDLSYGIYILHMPIINALIESNIPVVALAIALTLLAALASWFLIEKPALRAKRQPLRTVQ
jgi:peptidoglycan/LPS O-acetylase OafA/YrhL